jgi:hypothetical protein
VAIEQSSCFSRFWVSESRYRVWQALATSGKDAAGEDAAVASLKEIEAETKK